MSNMIVEQSYRTLFIQGKRDNVDTARIGAEALASVTESYATSAGTPPPPVVQFITNKIEAFKDPADQDDS